MHRARRALVDRLERGDKIIGERECGRRLHANATRHLHDKIVAIVGEDAPGVAGGTERVMVSLSLWYSAAVSPRRKRLAILRPRVSFSGMVAACTGMK